MKRVKSLPEQMILKAELGLESLFKFKDKKYMYLYYIGEKLMRKLYNEVTWEILHEHKTIDSVNAFLASGRFYHWHVDLGVRETNKYRMGRRYTV
jgi:hypothetical protein